MPIHEKHIWILKSHQYLLFIAFYTLFLTSCGENPADYKCDPLTATTQEVVYIQNKIEARIAKKTAPFDKSIKEMAEKTVGTSGAEFQAYASAIDKMALARANVVDALGLKDKLPSNILVSKYQMLMSKYANDTNFHLPTVGRHSSNIDIDKITPEDKKILERIIFLLKQISPKDADDIDYHLSLLKSKKDSVLTELQAAKDLELERQADEAKTKKRIEEESKESERQAIEAQKRFAEEKRIEKERERLKNNNLKIIKSLDFATSKNSSSRLLLNNWQLSIGYILNSAREITPICKIESVVQPAFLTFSYLDYTNVLLSLLKFQDWEQKVKGQDDKSMQKPLASFSLIDYRGANIGTDLIFKSNKNGLIKLIIKGGGWHAEFNPDEIQALINSLPAIQELEAKAEKNLNEKKSAAENNRKIVDELK